MELMKFTKTVLKNLFNKPATLMYPLKEREYYEVTRGHISIEIEKCIYCGICSRKCPTNAIKVDRSSKEWEINRLRCIQCNSCVENCPKKCLHMEKSYSKPCENEYIDKYKINIENSIDKN